MTIDEDEYLESARRRGSGGEEPFGRRAAYGVSVAALIVVVVVLLSMAH